MKTNQIFRRALSFLLCLCMVLSMGVTAFAAQGTATKAAGSAFESTKTLTNGGDSDPETYTIDIDALVNGEASEQHEGTPLDVAIIFDRSDSMSQPANVEDVRTITSQTDLANYLKTLDTTKPTGYYRASILSNTGARYYSDKSWGDDRYMCWEPMRYKDGQWEVFETCEATKYKDKDGFVREGAHGIVYESAEAGMSGYYGYWKSMSSAYTEFLARRKANSAVSATMPFRIAVPRLSMAQDAIAAFINNLNANADTLPAGQNHTVSITSFGGSVFKDGYALKDGFPLGKNGYVFYDTKWVGKEEYQSKCSYKSVVLTGSDATSAQKTELNNLFNEWKAAGSAGRDIDDELWQLFNNVRQDFFARRQAFFDERNAQWAKSIEAKKALIEEAAAITAEKNYSKEKTERMKALDREWKTAGYSGKNDNDRLWDEFCKAKEEFWSAKKAIADKRFQDQIDARQAKVEELNKQIEDLEYRMTIVPKPAMKKDLETSVYLKKGEIESVQKEIDDLKTKLS